MTTKHVLDSLPAYALGILDADEQAVVAAHLKMCASCQSELAALMQVADSLPLALKQHVPSPNLKAKLAARIAPEPVARKTGWLSRWRYGLALMLVALVAVVLITTRRAPIVTLSGTENAPAATAQLNTRTGQLIVKGLPQIPPDKKFQFWLIDEAGKRTSGALYSVDENGDAVVVVSADKPLTSWSKYGSSIEPAEGSPAPTGPPVLKSD